MVAICAASAMPMFLFTEMQIDKTPLEEKLKRSQEGLH